MLPYVDRIRHELRSACVGTHRPVLAVLADGGETFAIRLRRQRIVVEHQVGELVSAAGRGQRQVDVRGNLVILEAAAAGSTYNIVSVSRLGSVSV